MRFAVAICLVLIAAVAADPSCADIPAATTVWRPSCTNLTNGGDATCWSNGLPNANSVVSFPAGTNATIGAANDWPFTIFTVSTLIIEAGATITMNGDSIQVSNCFSVIGKLVLNSNPWVQGPLNAYLPDPAQPEGTDCSVVPIGFTPRVCGPGKISVRGTVSLNGIYSSIFISGAVEKPGTFIMGDQTFLWGNLSNYGQFSSNGYAYQHGFFVNYGQATLATVTFDKWATSYKPLSIPLLLENHGNLTLNGFLYPTYAFYQGTYRTVLFNYGTALVTGMLATSDFDVFNLGTLTWASESWMGFTGEGTFVNRGTMIADSCTVYLNIFQNLGGTLITQNYGQFNFGYSPYAESTMRLCHLVSNLPSDLEATYKANVKRHQVHLARSNVGSSVEALHQVRDGSCWWYGGFCYGAPYMWEPVAAKLEIGGEAPSAIHPTGVAVHRHQGQVRLHIQRLIAEQAVPEDPCQTRYTFSDGKVRGDGSGSIMSMVPISLTGTLEIGVGAKWYIANERNSAPVFGGGKLIVNKGGALFGGIAADFKFNGQVEVRRGGLFAVPRHATVQFSNHSLTLAPGSKLHVDGKLTFQQTKGARVTVDQCGLIDGIGDVTVSREGMLSCSKDAIFERRPSRKFRLGRK